MANKKVSGRQHQVVFEYLEALLMDAEDIEESASLTEKTEDENIVFIEEILDINGEIQTLKPEPEPEPEPEPASLLLGGELNCVLVNVCGLKLAVPFENIEGVLSLSTVTLQLENAYEWRLGSFVRGSIQSYIVDTGCWILSGRYDSAQSRYEELLVLEGKNWALACDDLEKSVRIPHSSINLNSDKKNRPWLLGTYMEERCAVVDVPALIKQLEHVSNDH